MLGITDGIGDASVIALAVGVAMAGIRFAERVFDAWRASRNGKDGEGVVIPGEEKFFRPKDRQVLGDVATIVGRTDALGRPLIYAPADLLDVTKKQLSVLEGLNETRREANRVEAKRISVCEKHTEILEGVKKKLKEGR